MTVKNLERIAYFASYVIKNVDVTKRDQIIADKEAEFEAAKLAIKSRYETEAKAEEANVKALAEAQTKELEELTEQYQLTHSQLTALDKYNLINESDYRGLPDDLRSIVQVGMGGSY